MPSAILSRQAGSWLRLPAITPAISKYTDQLYWFGHGSNEYFVIRVAAVFALVQLLYLYGYCRLVCSHHFSGMWAMYMTFAKIRPQVYKELAMAVFFLPSVFFWGSGLLKDSFVWGLWVVVLCFLPGGY